MAANPVSAFPTLPAGTQTDSDLLYVVDVSAGLAGSKKQTFLEASATTTAPGLVNNTTQSFSGAKTFTSSLQLGVPSTTTGSLILANAGGAFTTTLQGGAVAANRTLVLPAADPVAGQALVATLAGAIITLSYATVPTISGGVANTLALFSSASNLVSAGALTNGQLFIGSTGAAPVAALPITGVAGTDFAIAGGAGTLTFNLPVASAVNTGKLSAADWATFNAKVGVAGGAANQVAIFSGASSLTSSAFFTAPPATGYVTISGAVGDSTNNQANLLVNHSGSVGAGIRITNSTTGEAFDILAGTSGDRRFYINTEGFVFLNTAITLSGTTTGSGVNFVVLPGGIGTSMLDIWSDVVGPAVSVRLANSGLSANRFLSGRDNIGNFLFDIGATGTISWGAGTYAALDMTLGRVAANIMDITGAQVYLDNNMAFGWKDTTATRRALIQLDNGDNLTISGLANRSIRLVMGAAGAFRVTDNAISINNLEILDSGTVNVASKANTNIVLTPTSGTSVVSVTGTGVVSLGTASSLTGTLLLNNAASAFTTGLQSGAIAASRTYVLPVADPLGTQALVGTMAGTIITLSYATFAPALLTVSQQASGPVTVTAAATGTVYTNEGSSASVTFNLPAAAAGLHYTFIVQDADGIVVTAAAGDFIWIGSSSSSAGGTAASSTQMSRLDVVAVNGVDWVGLVSGTFALT